MRVMLRVVMCQVCLMALYLGTVTGHKYRCRAGARSPGKVLQTLPRLDVMECVARCDRDSLCVGLNLAWRGMSRRSRRLGDCFLMEDLVDPVVSPSASTRCVPRDPCEGSPCAENQTCESHGRSFWCQSPSTATVTTSPEPETTAAISWLYGTVCFPNPCINGGTCFVDPTQDAGIRCACSGSFWGTSCQYPI